MHSRRINQTNGQLYRAIDRYTKKLRRKRQLFRQRNRQMILKPTPMNEWKIVLGDLVEVTKGKDEGKQGKVTKVYRRGEAVLVKGCNLRLKKISGKTGDLHTFWKESRILVKHVALVDQDTNVPTPIEFKYQKAASDSEFYQRVRQSTVSGEIITKPEEAKPQRMKRNPHAKKDTLPSFAAIRSWIGPWELFTPWQQDFIVDDITHRKKIPNVRGRIADVMYNNVEEVHDYLSMLPGVPHTFFKMGTCEPHKYADKPIRKWSKNKMRRILRKGSLPLSLRMTDEVKRQLSKKRGMPAYFTHFDDVRYHPNNSYWPRVDPLVDPKYRDVLLETLKDMGGDTNQDTGVVTTDKGDLHPKASYIEDGCEPLTGYDSVKVQKLEWKEGQPSMHFTEDVNEELKE